MSKKIYGQIGVKGELIPEYIKGRISGIIDGVICDPERKRYAIAHTNDFTIFRFDATKPQFDKIKNLVTIEYSKTYELYVIEL